MRLDSELDSRSPSGRPIRGWLLWVPIVAVLSFGAGCETVVDLDIPSYEPRLAVYGFFSPDNAWDITLYRSAAPAEAVAAEDLVIADAVVVVSGQQGRDTLQAVAPGRYRSSLKPSVGEEYGLEIEAPGFDPVRALGSTPERPQVGTPRIDPIGTDIFTKRFRIVFTVDDPTGANYYRVGLFRDASHHGREWSPISFSSTDPAFRYSPDLVGALDLEGGHGHYQIAYFNDDLFEGGSRTFELFVDLYLTGRGNAIPPADLVVTSMSESYFEYHRTLELQRYNHGDPLAEPVGLFSNIEGGVGVFGGYANRVHVLQFD